MSTLTQDNKDFSNFHSSRSKRLYFLELRIRGLREDVVAALGEECDIQIRNKLKRFLDALDGHLEGLEKGGGE